jgi:hypothetical protein
LDDIVKQAMAKWPTVPDCYGWLGLDARGNWYMRDDRAQACGSFASGRAGAKGSLLQHAKLIDFIGRNYAASAEGCWFFQNGPQRVFVDLEATPWVWRINLDGSIRSHSGQAANFEAAYVDEAGYAYLRTDLGFGLVHTQDVALAAQAIEAGTWVLEACQRADLPRRFHYVTHPQAVMNPRADAKKPA